MALQPKMIACGTKKAILGMSIRFISGPLFMGAASVLVGLRGSRLHAAIVQVHIGSYLLLRVCLDLVYHNILISLEEI